MARPAPKRAYKARAPEVTSRMMARVRHRDSKAELILRSLLWKQGLRYRLHVKLLIGRPDLVFIRQRVVVFVDGDFWHGRDLLERGEEHFTSTMRTARRDWWFKKLSRNIERDIEVSRALSDAGWKVIRVWESDVLAEPQASADLIAGLVRSTGKG